MAEFATIADMQARYAAADLEQLTDGDGGINEARLETKLVSASNTVRGYVAAHYDSRFAVLPPLLVDLACTIALYQLYQHGRPDQVKEDYDNAMRSLRDIAAGKLKLDEGAEPAEPRGGAILTGGEGRKFSRSSMEGY